MHPHSVIGRDRQAVKGRSFDASTVRRVLGYAGRYRLKLIGFVLTLLGSSLMSVIPALLVRSIIDDAIPNGDGGLVNKMVLAMVAVSVVLAILSLVERSLSGRIGEGLIFDLRVQLFDHVQRLPMSFFTRTQTGALISRMNNDVIGAQRALTGTLGQVISNLIVLVTTLAAMFVLEWRLPLLALSLLPLFLIPTKSVGRVLQRLTRQQMDHNAEMNTTMTERLNVAGAMVVKLFGNHDRERERFADRAGAVRDLGVRSALFGRGFSVGLSLVGALGTAIVYWVGGRMAISGSITVGTVVAMGLYVERIYLPLTGLTNARVDIMTALVSFERVFEVLDTPNAIVDAEDAAELVSTQGLIEARSINFAYQESREGPESLEVGGGTQDIVALGHSGRSSAEPMRQQSGSAEPTEAAPEVTETTRVLEDISFRIEPGQTAALVGPSGAGKSTLIALLPRLYDVTSGSLSIDGHDVRALTQQSLRQSLGVVSQDPHLFHDTVGANLLYARPDASPLELRQACASAQILSVIEALPNGFDTIVGERGYRLSGGEKQRLAIARMLLKDPAIVVLDEATSHLDSENESLVQAALTVALKGRTAIVIAHRLSTIVAADVIFVLDGGKIVQSGRHDELLAAGGIYSELYEILSGRSGGDVSH